ncbi:LPS translocon maturation chaperone LptM [Gilvimarinus chinensis]|nr:lipoprotein [Gilvimarinus chinensis]
MRQTPVIFCLLMTCLCAGCGQTGPLYLPADEPAPKSDSAEK